MIQIAAFVGSLNIDLVWTSDTLPVPGQTVHGHRFAQHPGGKASNQAVACARMGGRPHIVGKVGDDAYGPLLEKSLADAGVSVGSIKSAPGHSCGTAGIFVDAAGENQIVFAPGANATLTAGDVSFALAMIRPEWVVAQNEVPMEATLAAARFGSRFIFNPAPAGGIPEEIWPMVWLATPNETEAEAITGIAVVDDASCQAACDWLHSRGVQEVIITLGGKGVWLSRHGLIPGFPVEAVDTTAAGDCFTGSLTAFLSGGVNLPTGARWACAASALSVTRHGAQVSIPSLSQVQAFLAQRGAT